MDQEALLAIQTDDVVYNVAGRTPISGRWVGKSFLTGEAQSMVFGALDPERFRFSRRWKIMCADAERVVGFMEADGPTRSGKRYNQRYCQVFAFRDGRISEVWEFFDSCLAEEALFDNPLSRPEQEPAEPFRF